MALLTNLPLLPQSRALRDLLIVVCAFSIGLCVTSLRAQPPTEYDIKAVYLFNFARFVDWPDKDATDKPLMIGVLGQDPFGSRLDEALRGEKSNNRPLVVRRLKNVDEASDCDVLFISLSEQPRLPQILAKLNGRPILTVSDIPSFAERGGMVGLVTEDEKVRLHINVEVAKISNLAISAKLLRPARIVTTRTTSLYLPGHCIEDFVVAFSPLPKTPAQLDRLLTRSQT